MKAGDVVEVEISASVSSPIASSMKRACETLREAALYKAFQAPVGYGLWHC